MCVCVFLLCFLFFCFGLCCCLCLGACLLFFLEIIKNFRLMCMVKLQHNQPSPITGMSDEDDKQHRDKVRILTRNIILAVLLCWVVGSALSNLRFVSAGAPDCSPGFSCGGCSVQESPGDKHMSSERESCIVPCDRPSLGCDEGESHLGDVLGNFLWFGVC